MKYLIPFSLFEALELPIARKATKVFLDSGGKNRYNEYFKGKDRIYLDFSEGDDLSDTGEKVENVLTDNGYEMISYFKGLCRKKSDPERILKIQRILNKLGMIVLKDEMDRDRSRASSTKDEKKVVISRHGIDYAGASTDRDWYSCREIVIDDDWEEFYEFHWEEIKQGSLIAYLINSDDINIKNPIARTLIFPYFNSNDPSDILLYPDEIFGNANQSFWRFVRDECLEITKKINPKFNKKIGSINYKINTECHSETWGEVTSFGGEVNTLKHLLNISDIGERIDQLFHSKININMNNFFDMIVSEGFIQKENWQKDINSIFHSLNILSKDKRINILDALEISDSKIREFIRKYPDIFAFYLKNIIPRLDKIDDIKSKAIVESYITVFRDRMGEDINIESMKNFLSDLFGYYILDISTKNISSNNNELLLSTYSYDINTYSAYINANNPGINKDSIRMFILESISNWIMKKANEFGLI